MEDLKWKIYKEIHLRLMNLEIQDYDDNIGQVSGEGYILEEPRGCEWIQERGEMKKLAGFTICLMSTPIKNILIHA